ncbi:MAG: hypothetical protein B6I31_03565 [Desulfobacteraceae bacterium 4572_19]|nr:MAG: hypothetical protein B6I31_03565 [Desulfobacteraceae bacterium 4572_19]
MDASSGKNSGIKDLARSLSILAASGYPVLLDKWEEPVLKKKRKKITVSVCGANPHPKLDSEPDTNSKNDSKSKNNNQNRNIKLKKKPTETNNFNSAKESGSLYKSNNIIKLKDSTNTVENIKINNTEKIKTVHSNVQPTLKVVQEGLKSIHLLHSQTTEAHKLFLETQAEAGRALQSMMDKTKFLTDIPTEFNSVATAPPQPVINAESVTDNYNNLSATTKSETLSNTVSNEDSSINENSYINHHNEIPVTKKDTAINKAHYKTPSETNSKIKTDETVQVILEVVSSLTGYPIEMLDLDMDIESDLGIDSIKRVEILSAVEEKLPEVNSISPDEMGTIRTLGQIAKHLTGSEQSLKSDSLHLHNSEPEPNNSVEILKQNDIQLNSAREEITENLLNVVSSLTGYPIDMLEIEMDIESDLGIDSIKRVEILSAFEECMPNTKSISPDMMGELKTLKHIIDYLDDSHRKKKLQISCIR